MGFKDFINILTGSTVDKSRRERVDRALRVRINYLHDLEFIALEPRFSKPLKIDNISISGIGLIVPSDANHAQLESIVGELIFASGSKHSLVLKVVRFNGDHVGVTIEKSTPSFVMALEKYFEFEIEALQLKSTRADVLKAVSDGTPHWFQGSNNCDLFYISNGNEVVELTISVFGNHIEGGAKKPLQFSEISEKTAGETFGYKASDLLYQKSAPDAAMLVLAKRVVNAVEGLPIDHRDSILKILR